MHNDRPKILVVDDEPSVLLTVEAILRQEGYDVDSAGGGSAAIAAIRERHYDLVLTDLKMPGVDGMAVLAEVRKNSPTTVTVMMTGYGSVGTALEAIQLGAYEYLMKPTEVAELKAAVHRSLERKRFSEIDTLYSLSRAVSSTLDASFIATQVAEATRRVLGVANACLVAFSSGDHHPPSLCPEELQAVLADSGLREKLLAGEVVGPESDLPAAAAWAAEHNRPAYVFVPGLSGGELVCLLCSDNGRASYDFHESARRFLRALASQAAMALENALLVAELKRNNQELAAANRQLRELDQLKSQFLSVATHELRTPLTIILGYNTMLADSLEARLSPDERATLEESVAACKRLIRLVNSMLDISQIQSGRMQMQFAPADLRQVVNSSVALFQHQARDLGIYLAVDMPARLPRVWLDPERIQQVLINLLANALKFTPEGGRVRVSVRHLSEREAVEIAVSDTGVGISPEDQHMIFDEFAQIRRQAGQRQREGSGLGLAITRRIVEAHAGRVEVESRLGQGSTFKVVLPASARRLDHATTAVSA